MFLDTYSDGEAAIIQLLDKDIAVERDTELLHKLVRVIIECLKLKVDKRPEMTEIAECLQGMKRSQIKHPDA